MFYVACLALYLSMNLTSSHVPINGSTLSSKKKEKKFPKTSPVRSSLTPPCYPYAISKGEGGKYPKKNSNGNLIVEMWTYIL